jgi:hypothetical protein
VDAYAVRTPVHTVAVVGDPVALTRAVNLTAEATTVRSWIHDGTVEFLR